MTFDAYTVALHVLVCKTCGTKAEDVDADRLTEWMIEHAVGCE